MYRLYVLVLGLLLSVSAFATTAPQRLHRFLDGLQTLEAQFDQTVTSSDHVSTARARGTLYLSRPGRFRWSYTDPDGQLVVADGDRVWLYDPDLEQVSHQSQAEALRGTPALLLSDTGPVDKHFKVVDLGDDMGLDWVELIPKAKGSEVVKVLVGFKGDQLAALEMVDTFGQTTRFHFHNVQRNPKLNPALFHYTPPPGIDVMGR
jgi:outer membrane lipoprotein carrier protein